jgi:hypothetical protein
MLSSHHPHFIFYTQPLKMELTEGSETSANHNLTPGKYPKEHIQYSTQKFNASCATNPIHTHKQALKHGSKYLEVSQDHGSESMGADGHLEVNNILFPYI